MRRNGNTRTYVQVPRAAVPCVADGLERLVGFADVKAIRQRRGIKRARDCRVAGLERAVLLLCACGARRGRGGLLVGFVEKGHVRVVSVGVGGGHVECLWCSGDVDVVGVRICQGVGDGVARVDRSGGEGVGGHGELAGGFEEGGVLLFRRRFVGGQLRGVCLRSARICGWRRRVGAEGFVSGEVVR